MNVLDFTKTMDSYLDHSDWRVKENSNVNFSIGGLMLHNSSAIVANYWLTNIYPQSISDAHKNADFHLHDLGMFSGYCAGWSIRQILTEGVGGVSGRISSKPPKHLSTLVNQLVNFLGIMQNEWAGAQAFSSFDTYLAPFIRAGELSFNEVKQAIQSFIFGVNTPSRWGSQAPFTNITLDWTVPEDLKNQPVIIGGEFLDSTYSDYQAEMDMINRAFLEVMNEGDANGRGFQYPIPTYNITNDFDWDSDNARLLFEITAKYGTPYFQNFINSDLNPSDVRSMCCRLQLDKRELRKKGGGLFGADEFTGSIGVVTINLPRIGYLAKTETDFFDRLDSLMDLASESLFIKRKLVTKLMRDGFFPYTERYLRHLGNHFSTIGINGMHECLLNFMGVGITNQEAYAFAVRVLDHMRAKMVKYQEATGDLFNLEATPAESTSYRLARHDVKAFPDIITSGDKSRPYYTNSTQLPVDLTTDLFMSLDLQETLQRKYTGGTVFHVFLGEAIDSWEGCAKLVKKLAISYKIPYFTMSPTFSICPIHGYLRGEFFECPICLDEKRDQLINKIRTLENRLK